MSETTNKKITIKVKKPKKTKKDEDIYVRLLDFDVFDQDEEVESDEEDNAKYVHHKQFMIQMFGLDEKGDTYSIYVDDYKPFFYLKVDYHWNNSHIHELIPFLIKETSKYYRTAFVTSECKIVEHKTLYGFDNNKKYKFVKLTFQSVQAMNKIKGLWYNYVKGERIFNEKGIYFNDTHMKLYEANIPPLLRMFHIKDISPSGWISFKAEHAYKLKGDMKETNCKHEYMLNSYKKIISLPEKETPVPYKICSFDIEASSSHGDFPLPVKTYKKLVTNILDFWDNTILKDDDMKNMNKEQTDEFIKDCIFTAFNKRIICEDKEEYDSLYEAIDFNIRSDIDCVYTKKHLSIEQINKMIDKTVSVYVANVNKEFLNEESDETNDLIMDVHQNRIDEILSAMEESEEIIDGDEGAVNSDDFPSNPFYKKRSYFPKIRAKLTVSDVLMNSRMSRENKLLNITKVFDLCLPAIEGDKVTFIGSTFLKFGEKEPYLNHCIALDTCSNVEGAVIEQYSTEKDVLLAWRDLIQREDPDIIIGYNIFGFDYSFMFRRVKSYGEETVREFLKMSRNKEQICGNLPWDKETKMNKENYEIEQSHTKVASGEYNLEYIKMNGRIQVDLLGFFRKDYNLVSYKLDYVSGYFISDKIKKYEYIEDTNVTKMYSKNLLGLKAQSYIHIEETGHTSEYYKNGAKFKVVEVNKEDGYLTISGKEEPDVKKVLKWCLAKDDVTPQDIFRMTNEGPDERAIIAKYCIQDCNLVHNLMNKIDMMTTFVEMANICSVPMQFIILRGQGIRLFSFVAKECMKKDTLVPVLQKKDDGGYEGAIVLPPKTGIYLDNPVACVDYSSLYPSSMISENISHDSKVLTMEYDNDGKLIRTTGHRDSEGNFIYDNLEGYKYVNIEYDTYEYLHKCKVKGCEFKNKDKEVVEKHTIEEHGEKKAPSKAEKTKVGSKLCRFAQFPNGELGIIPSILKTLLAARKATRASAKWKTLTTSIGEYTGLIIDDKDDKITMKDKNGHIKVIEKESIIKKEDTFNDFMKNVLDKRQLAIKVTANSVYGQSGAKTSSFYEKDVAASTTATGRKLLTYGKRVIEDVYGDLICETKYGKVHSHAEYIYGDTDSVFMSFNLTDPETGKKIVGKEALKHTIELAKEAGEMATKYLKAPHDLEYEKTFLPFCLLSKKRYVGMLYEEDPDKCYRKSMGIVLKRRDNAPIVKDVYGGVIDILMKENNPKKVIDFVHNSMSDLMNSRVPMEKLIITKSLRGFYKRPESIAHKVLADRIAKRDPGNKPKAGDRIPFVFIETDTKSKLQGDKIELPTYIVENNLKIDYRHYIEKQLMLPLSQVLQYILPPKKELERKYKKLEFKKREKEEQKRIKEKVFNIYLTKELSNQKQITSYFTPKPK